MSISRAELAKLSPAELARLEAVTEALLQDKEAGKVPWLCDLPGCDGAPHEGRWGKHARAAQRPPDGEWDVWMCLAGRGWGKTRVGAEWAILQARQYGRGALIGPTAADTRDVLVEGESGIMACAPATFRPVYEPSKRRLTYPNGAIQMCYSADEPNRLRGPQHHYGWFDELAAWRYMETWDMAQLGMRLGDHPKICVTTTPRPIPLVKQLLKDPMTVTVRGSTYDNLDNLAPTFRRAVVAKYEGTTLGRQELDAEVLEDLPGALVARRHIDENRITESQLPELVRIVVGMDPAGTGTGDETGLSVVGAGPNGHMYVLADASEKLTPLRAASKAWALLESSGASLLVVEDNGGKDWIETVLKRAWKDNGNEGNPPLRRVNASHGKKLRAQPVAMRYEQGRVHHVGSFPELEDQLTTWIPEEDPASPDRIDAMVHAAAHHMRKESGTAVVSSPYGAARRLQNVSHPGLGARGRAS